MFFYIPESEAAAAAPLIEPHSHACLSRFNTREE